MGREVCAPRSLHPPVHGVERLPRRGLLGSCPAEVRWGVGSQPSRCVAAATSYL